MFVTGILGCVGVVGISVVVFAFRERATLARELAAVVAGVARRKEPHRDIHLSSGVSSSPELEDLLDEAVQTESHLLAVLAVSELGGRAGLRRSRALLFSRGLPRIALLSGGGGAFVVAAAGNFSRHSLAFAGASVLLGLTCSFACFALNSASRHLAKQYVGITEVLGREVDRHFRSSDGVQSQVEPAPP